MTDRPAVTHADLVAVPVWDIWVRLFHWGLVLAVAASFLTDQIGDLDSHYIAGLTILGLVVFRLLWGLVGSSSARFTTFLSGPGAILAYLRHAIGRRPSFSHGHNPAGAVMVVLMLLMITGQAVSGLFNSDDILFEGPLYGFAGSAVRDFMSDWHEILGNVILALIGIHVVVILLYRAIKGENLVRAMITGRARLPRPVGKVAESNGATQFASPLRGLICVAIAAAVPLAIHWMG